MRQGKFADIHQHVLWGLDDGAQTANDMHALLEQDARDGVGLVFATAHGSHHGRPLNLQTYADRLQEANDYASARGLNLRILPGCEIFYQDSTADLLADGRLLPLGNTRSVLVEFHEDVTFDEIRKASDRLYNAGFSPILAHVERYKKLVRRPWDTMALRSDYGLTFQMNCGTVLHANGLLEQLFVRYMLRANAIDVVASDAHDVKLRPVQMRAACDAICDQCSEVYARQVVSYGWTLAGEKQ